MSEMTVFNAANATGRRRARPAIAAFLRERGAGFSLVILFMLAFIVPNQIALDLGGVRLPPLRIALLALLIPIIMALLRRQGGKLYDFDKWYIAFVLWTVLCILLNRGLGGVEPAGQFALEYIVVYMMAQGCLTSVSRLRAVLNLTVLLALGLLMLAIPEALDKQYYTQNFANALMGLPMIVAREDYVRMGMQRAMTVFTHPILYGVFCATLVGLIWQIERRPFQRFVRIAILVAATFFSLSSAPFLVIIVQLFLMVIERATRWLKNRVKIFLSILFTLFVLLETFTGRGFVGTLMIFTLDPATAYYRKLIWENGIDDVLRNPIFGMRPEEWTRLPWMTASIDNEWLLQMMRGGVPSLIFLAIAVWLLTRRLYARPDRAIPDVLARLRRGWLFMMIALFLCGSTVAFFDKLQSFFALMIGVGGAIARLMIDWEKAGAAASGTVTGHPAATAAPAPQRRTIL